MRMVNISSKILTLYRDTFSDPMIGEMVEIKSSRKLHLGCRSNELSLFARVSEKLQRMPNLRELILKQYFPPLLHYYKLIAVILIAEKLNLLVICSIRYFSEIPKTVMNDTTVGKWTNIVKNRSDIALLNIHFPWNQYELSSDLPSLQTEHKYRQCIKRIER